MSGSREIYHILCEHCKSAGYFTRPSKRKCRECDGVGWLKVGRKQEVCKECDGAGKIIHINQRRCEECEGNGFLTCVVEEIDRYLDECEKCSGAGTVLAWVCRGSCGETDVYLQSDGMHCKSCRGRVDRVTINCSACKGTRGKKLRKLRDIKSGKVFVEKVPKPKRRR